jgi:hypothetical protein
MTAEQQLRQMIRQILKEISTTGGVAGYLTPMAFSGNSRKNKVRKARVAQQNGWKLTKRGAKELTRGSDNLRENTTHD